MAHSLPTDSGASETGEAPTAGGSQEDSEAPWGLEKRVVQVGVMLDISVIEELVEDDELFVETILQIEDKSRRRVPFTLKPIQRDMVRTRTGRDVYVKPAQVGSTSILMALYYKECVTRPGTNSVVVAHEEFITQRLLKKVHSFIETAPSGLPQPYHQSAYEITWPKLNSSFYIGTARSYVFGRGETIHNLLCSEYAFWPYTGRIIGPALERVPPDGHIDIESTPNGEGNDFYELYTGVQERIGLGTSRFTSHFYPWTMEPDYTLPPDSPYALPIDRHTPLELTREEEEVIEKLGADEDQIRWRRMKIGELELLKRNGEMVKLFPQEFPEDDLSCFIVSGDMVYDLEILADMDRNSCKPVGSRNGLDIWVYPKEGFRYSVVIDPGQGKVTQTAITVWRFWIDDQGEHGEHCATMAGLIPTDLTALYSKDIGSFYNRAMLIPEANAHGLAVVNGIKDYGNVYWRKDIVSGRLSRELGWLTTKKTKPFMINELKSMLPRLTIRDADIIAELRNIRYSDANIVSVGRDDLHDTVAIAVSCRQSRTVKKGYVGSAGWKW